VTDVVASIPETPLTEAEFGELVALCGIVASESLHYFGGLQPTNSQRDRRAFVRAFFASVGTLLWTLRRLALSRHYAGQHSFPPNVLHELRTQGNVGPAKALSTVLPAFGDAYGVHVANPRLDPGWPSFATLIAVRNRITHPKRLSEFDVADTELDQLRAAHQWFWNVTFGPMNAIGAAHNNKWV